MMVLLSMVPMAAGNAIKELVGRPRPDYLLLGPMPGNMSFPSGHSIWVVLFCGILILLAEEQVRAPLVRRVVQVGLVLLILAVGASRVYLGVHWPSDIIGGYFFGTMTLLGLVQLRNRLANRRRQPSP
jgi:undecaprenyl-diphosphatase